MQLQDFLDTTPDATFLVNASPRIFVKAFPLPDFKYFPLKDGWVNVTLQRPSLIKRDGTARAYYEVRGEARSYDTGKVVAIAGLGVLMGLTRVGTNRTYVELWTEKTVMKKYLFSVLEVVAEMWPEADLAKYLEGEESAQRPPPALEKKRPGRHPEPAREISYQVWKAGAFSKEAYNQAFAQYCEEKGIKMPGRDERKMFQKAMQRARKADKASGP